MKISVQKTDGRAFLVVGNQSIELKDYKISSSMRGGIELEAVIFLDDSITIFSSSANPE